MSLLTKKQQTIFGNIHQAEANAFYNPDPGCGNQFMNARVAVIELLSIIDDLQARAPRQYTEQELRGWLETTNLSFADCPWVRHEPTHKLIKPEHMKYKDPRDEAMWFAVYNFARISGALKAEP